MRRQRRSPGRSPARSGYQAGSPQVGQSAGKMGPAISGGRLPDWMGGPGPVLDVGGCLDPAVFDGGLERGVVAVVLVGVGLGEVGDSLVEFVGAAEVGGQRDAVTGTGVGPGQGPPAHLRVDRHARGDHLLDRRGPLPVLELAYVVVAIHPVGAGHAGPAEEDVAFGLHQELPGDDPLAVAAVGAAPAVSGQGGGLGFLGLQEQRLGPVPGVHQRDPAAGADTAHPDHLAGHLDQRELLQQVLAVGLQGALVFAQRLADLLIDRTGLLIGEDLLDRHDQRGVADDPPLPVGLGGQLALRLHAVGGVGLGDHLLGGLDPCLFHLRPVPGDRVVDVQVGIPHRQERLVRKGAHRAAVSPDSRQDDLAAGLAGEPVRPPGHGQAGGQPLDVPLERAGQGLVEVVDVKDQPPRGGGERAEIGQVRIPAQLHPQPRGGGGGQVGRHRQRRAPVERERRHQHPPVPDWQQLRHPGLFLLQQQPDRIPRRARGELRVRLQRSRRPGVLPPRLPVRPAQLLRSRGPRPAPARRPHGRPSSPRRNLSLHRHGHPFRPGPAA